MNPKIKISFVLIIIFMMLIASSCKNSERRKFESFDAYNLGVKAVKSDNLDLAVHYFQRASLLNPNFVEAKLNLANAQFLSGNLDDARELYSTLISEQQFDPRLLFNLGWIYMLQEDFKTANDLFLKSRKSDPEFYDSDYGLANLALARNQPVLVKFYLEKYLLDVPDGRWTLKAEKILASLPPDISDLLQLPENDPLSIDADIQPQNPDPELADPVEKKLPENSKPAIEKKPATDDTETKIITKKEPTTPEKVVEPVKPKKPVEKKKTVSELIAEGKSALKNGDITTAEKRFKEARSKDRKSNEIPLNLAIIYYKKNKLSDEKKYLNEYLKLSGKDKPDNFDLAAGFELIGDNSRAIDSYRKYLASNPFGENAQKAKEKLTELDKLASEN